MNIVIYIVNCPSCSAQAAAEMHPVGTKGTYREVLTKMGAKRIVCNACGFCQDVSQERADSYDLWYASEFKRQRLWAVNQEHLAFLISWFAGEISKEDLRIGDRALVEAFPKWMILDLLKCLRKMRDGNANKAVQRTGASRSAHRRNRRLVAAGSRR